MSTRPGSSMLSTPGNLRLRLFSTRLLQCQRLCGPFSRASHPTCRCAQGPMPTGASTYRWRAHRRCTPAWRCCCSSRRLEANRNARPSLLRKPPIMVPPRRPLACLRPRRQPCRSPPSHPSSSTRRQRPGDPSTAQRRRTYCGKSGTPSSPPTASTWALWLWSLNGGYAHARGRGARAVGGRGWRGGSAPDGQRAAPRPPRAAPSLCFQSCIHSSTVGITRFGRAALAPVTSLAPRTPRELALPLRACASVDRPYAL